jgi:hemoglobin
MNIDNFRGDRTYGAARAQPAGEGRAKQRRRNQIQNWPKKIFMLGETKVGARRVYRIFFEGGSTMHIKIIRKNELAKIAVAAILVLSVFTSGTSVAKDQTLYERLGGYDAVSAVVDDFAGKLFVDPVVGARFFGMSADSREGFRQKNKNLVCKVTGGPCKIISRSAATTHGGLGIKASEFNIVAQHLVDTLNKFKVPGKEHKELMAIIATLRPDIVEVEDK